MSKHLILTTTSLFAGVLAISAVVLLARPLDSNLSTLPAAIAPGSFLNVLDTARSSAEFFRAFLWA